MSAGRVLLRATASGLAAAAVVSLHYVATWQPPEIIPSFIPTMRDLLLESVPGLQSAVLRAHPLYGAHLRDVRARAELDLARVDAVGPDGDAAAATDLRLLLALLAARPRALAYYACILTNRAEEAKNWNAAYRRLVPESEIVHPKFPGYFESEEMAHLIGELTVAKSLGGSSSLVHPSIRTFVMRCALQTVDADLAVAQEQDRTLSKAERLQVRALRVCLYSTVRRLVREDVKIAREKHNHNGGDR